MSARKLNNQTSGFSQSPTTQRLTLPTGAVRVRKNGIEFRNDEAITPWTEMTVSLQGPNPARKVNFTGVVVACSPDPKSGYVISMLFTHVSRLSQARLLAYS